MNVVEHEVVKRPGYQTLVLRVRSPHLNLPNPINEVEVAVLDLLAKGTYQLVVMDLSEVEQLNSAGLGMLLKIHKRVRQRNGQVRVTGLIRPLATTYRLCMMDRIMPSSPTVAQALEAHDEETGQHGAGPAPVSYPPDATMH